MKKAIILMIIPVLLMGCVSSIGTYDKIKFCEERGLEYTGDPTTQSFQCTLEVSEAEYYQIDGVKRYCQKQPLLNHNIVNTQIINTGLTN